MSIVKTHTLNSDLQTLTEVVTVLKPDKCYGNSDSDEKRMFVRPIYIKNEIFIVPVAYFYDHGR